MIAKMICHAETREQAIAKTIRAIDEYEITGIETTLGFCRYVLEHDAFRTGDFDTKFVEKYFRPEVLKRKPEAEEEMLAAALSSLLIAPGTNTHQKPAADAPGKWKKNRTL
jgi:propionyl-CoA carboxylase alpha chain